MSLTNVKITEEVWLTCLTHGLSTESEEVMGLLLGDIEQSKSGGVTALIWGASPQKRSDRRKDRVETNPEQLASASAQAEHIMSMTVGRTTRVIGWYHSHPHITVYPSHVDVRTQAMYQLLDSGFIGLIFSCFNENVDKVGRIEVTAFQSSDGKQLMSGPASVSPLNGEGRSSELGRNFENADQFGQNPGIDIDPMDMSESMQEALHRSNWDISGAEYVERKVPLQVLPTSSIIHSDSPLCCYTDLQRVLYEEEREAYNHAISQNMRDGKVHPLTFIHHTSTYQASLCKLMEYCLSPAIYALQERLKENETQLKILAHEARNLEFQAFEGPRSPSSLSRHGLGGSSSVGHAGLHLKLQGASSPSRRSKRGS